MQDTNGKLINQRQNFCDYGFFKAMQENREGREVRKYVIQFVTTIIVRTVSIHGLVPISTQIRGIKQI